MKRQRGGMLVLLAITLPLLAGSAVLALQVSQMWQRQAEMQQVADVVALAAAQQLDGSASGVQNALLTANGVAAQRSVRGFGQVMLGADALGFAASASPATWRSYQSALAAPAGLRYVRVDTAQLSPQPGVLAVLAPLLHEAAQMVLSAQAVAGPRAVRVLPLAICALSTTAMAVRNNGGSLNEAVEYGMRSGVTYNLLQLNPAAGAASGEYFLVDPLSPPGSAPSASSSSDAQVAPYMCAGKLAYPSVTGGALNLRRNAGFNLWQQLNSRFGSYGGSNACDPLAAPPDTNVRAYLGAQAGWQNSAPAQASAAATTPAAGKPLTTIADPAPPLPAAAPAQYGTLWAYGAARRAGGGYFSNSNVGVLYPAAPALSLAGWSSSPYRSSAYSSAPSLPGRRERRLLHVPLLSCPVGSGSLVQASVLAVGRFLLTAPASASEVPAEFIDTVSDATLATDVELLQ